MPQDGKDEIYDTNAQEINELTEELDAKLEEYGEELGFVSLVVILPATDNQCRCRCKDLTWWHSPNGTKVRSHFCSYTPFLSLSAGDIPCPVQVDLEEDPDELGEERFNEGMRHPSLCSSSIDR